MGGVIIESFNAQVGANPLNAFTLWEDDFSSYADVAAAIREYLHILPGTSGVGPNVNTSSPALAGGVLSFTQPNLTNTNYGMWIPRLIIGACNKSQFSEMIVSAQTAAGLGRYGLGVLCWGDHRQVAGNSAAYVAHFARDTSQVIIRRALNGNAPTVLLTINSIPAIGNRATFTADLESSPGNVVLDFLDNGVSIGTVTDIALPNTFGSPCFYDAAAGGAGQSWSLTEFRCGILSRL